MSLNVTDAKRQIVKHAPQISQHVLNAVLDTLYQQERAKKLAQATILAIPIMCAKLVMRLVQLAAQPVLLTELHA